jgi:DNA-binding transcriptional LysR family regulator
MTETEIRYFLAVYRNRNITKAAEELIVTRPVVSRALVKIEK